MKKDIILGVATLLTLVGVGFIIAELLPDNKEQEEKGEYHDHDEEASEQ